MLIINALNAKQILLLHVMAMVAVRGAVKKRRELPDAGGSD
jgi:hypothetical protein